MVWLHSQVAKSSSTGVKFIFQKHISFRHLRLSHQTGSLFDPIMFNRKSVKTADLQFSSKDLIEVLLLVSFQVLAVTSQWEEKHGRKFKSILN